MGKLFKKGPSDGDIERAEQKAFEQEAERLRLQEMNLRQRESSETIQGEGIATAGSVEIGSDAAFSYDSGLDRVVAHSGAAGQTVGGDDIRKIQEAARKGTFTFNKGLKF